MTIKESDLIKPLPDSVVKEGYIMPASMQQQSIFRIFEGEDFFGCEPAKPK